MRARLRAWGRSRTNSGRHCTLRLVERAEIHQSLAGARVLQVSRDRPSRYDR